MRNFRDLRVWRKAHELTLALYRVSRAFPKDELYGLTSQIRRCCVSIEANLAEGCGRHSEGEMGRFVQIAMGSGSELECHLQIALDLQFLSAAEHSRLQEALTEVRRMLSALSQKIRASSQEPKAKS